MKPPRNLADIWPDWLKPHTTRYDPKEKFDKHLYSLVANLAVSAALDPEGEDFVGKSEPEVIEMLRSRYNGSVNVHLNNLAQIYRVANEERVLLRDQRAQYNWATTWDHTKTLLFRAATTMMIAGVILATGFLAKAWEIPLPMLRGF